MNKFLIRSKNNQMYERHQLTQSFHQQDLLQNTRPLRQQQSRLKSTITPKKQNQLRQTSLLRQTALKYQQTSRLRQTHHMFDQTFAEQIFMRSINRSYIGQMSGKKQQLHQIKFEQLQQEPVDLQYSQSRMIGLSRFHQEQLPQIKETLITYEDAQYMNIVAFSHNNSQLFKKPQCMPCSTQYKSQCKIEIVNKSIIEIYARNEKDAFDILLLTFNFDTITAEVQFEDILQNRQIVITAGTYRLLIQHQQREIVQWWFQKLQSMIQQSKGRHHSLTSLLNTELFYKQRFQTQQYFSAHCETGDIILFQDDHFFAKAQRFFTQSDYDHVGMVIKDLNYGTLIFEANSGSGVCLTPWKYVIKYEWYKSIPKIAWRKLRKVDKNYSFNTQLQKFILQNLQKHYHISFAKILANQSIIRPPVQDLLALPEKPKSEDDTGFFCSELIATVYKELGLLTRDIASPNYQPACKFYPKDFSERSGRKLDQGELSPEYTIYFDDILLKAQNA